LSFSCARAAIQWHLRSGALKHYESACVSVPPQLRRVSDDVNDDEDADDDDVAASDAADAAAATAVVAADGDNGGVSVVDVAAVSAAARRRRYVWRTPLETSQVGNVCVRVLYFMILLKVYACNRLILICYLPRANVSHLIYHCPMSHFRSITFVSLINSRIGVVGSPAFQNSFLHCKVGYCHCFRFVQVHTPHVC
jgi:hypothetical protein